LQGQGDYLSIQTIKQRVGRSLRGLWCNRNRTYAGFSDNEFYVPTRDELDAFLTERPIRHADECDESFDCDDFAFVLKGMISLYARRSRHLRASVCLGIGWGKFQWVPDTFHAVNWALVDGSEFVWLEPQDGSVHAVDECEGGLTLILA